MSTPSSKPGNSKTFYDKFLYIKLTFVLKRIKAALTKRIKGRDRAQHLISSLKFLLIGSVNTAYTKERIFVLFSLYSLQA